MIPLVVWVLLVRNVKLKLRFFYGYVALSFGFIFFFTSNVGWASSTRNLTWKLWLKLFFFWTGDHGRLSMVLPDGFINSIKLSHSGASVNKMNLGCWSVYSSPSGFRQFDFQTSFGVVEKWGWIFSTQMIEYVEAFYYVTSLYTIKPQGLQFLHAFLNVWASIIAESEVVTFYHFPPFRSYIRYFQHPRDHLHIIPRTMSFYVIFHIVWEFPDINYNLERVEPTFTIFKPLPSHVEE